MSAAIEFEGVERHFAGRAVLRGLDLVVRPGEAYGLLGRNGAGTTTALRILLGFLEAHRGEARVLGIPSRDLGPAERARIGYLPEGQQAFVGMPLHLPELVAYEAATRSGFRADWFTQQLRRFELPTDRAIALLSRGQRAQVALLCALAERPEILIFDDPAMGLDPVVRHDFLDAVIDFLSGEGVTVLFSSHLLADVERIADRVGILHGGALIVDATTNELRQRVQRRFLRVVEGPGPKLDGLPGILRARRGRDGIELLLLDMDAERERAFRERGAALSEPRVPNLEEIFYELTTSGSAEPVDGANGSEAVA